jgi:uncharacterized protein YbjT (DUF2867 family)
MTPHRFTVSSGKTTLVQHLAARIGAVTAAEYTALAPLPPWSPADTADVAAALRHFLDLERHRAGRHDPVCR